jgi:hypothetical protein
MRFSLPLFLFAIVAALSGCSKRLDPLTSAQQFFTQVGSGQTDAAYQSAAFGFQSQRTPATFAAAARDMGLTDYAAGEWGPPDRDGRTVKIRVNVRTRAGTQFPLIVTLLDEAGAWRVYSLRSPPSEKTGISENRFSLVGKVPNITDEVVKPMPTEQEIRRLVRANLLRFNQAIASQSFDAFYDSVSAKWQEALTKGQLQREFQPFIDNKIDLSAADKTEPVLDPPPVINSEGLLVVSGQFPMPSYRAVFNMKFYYELPEWKLFGLDVAIVK